MDDSVSFDQFRRIVGKLSFIDEAAQATQTGRSRKENRPRFPAKALTTGSKRSETTSEMEADRKGRETNDIGRTPVFSNPRLRRLAAAKKCFTCESPDHFAKDCPKERRPKIAASEIKPEKRIKEINSDSESEN